MNDAILIRHHSGTRFTATAQGYTVVVGKGDPEKGGEDGMTPGMLFAASLGLCVGVTLVAYCKNRGLLYEGMTNEMVRENTEDGRRMKTTTLHVRMPSELSDKELEVLHRVAHRCYVGQSITGGMKIEIARAPAAGAR